MQIFQWDRNGFEQTYSKSYYRARGCGAVKARACGCTDYQISYSRQFFEDDQLFKVRAENIINYLQLPIGSDIFVVGCALGLLMEELKLLGMNVWGCDSSQYIHTIKNKEKAKFPIHNIDVTTPNFVSLVGSKTGATWFNVVITEDLLSSHTSYNQILDNCEGILEPGASLSKIVHIVDTNVTVPFTVKSEAQWVSTRDTHTWLDVIGKPLVA